MRLSEETSLVLMVSRPRCGMFRSSSAHDDRDEKKPPLRSPGRGPSGMICASPRRPAPGLNKAENADENEADRRSPVNDRAVYARGADERVSLHGRLAP